MVRALLWPAMERNREGIFRQLYVSAVSNKLSRRWLATSSSRRQPHVEVAFMPSEKACMKLGTAAVVNVGQVSCYFYRLTRHHQHSTCERVG